MRFLYFYFLDGGAGHVQLLILGAIVGRYLLSRVNERVFLWLYYATLIALSLKLILWNGILQVWA